MCALEEGYRETVSMKLCLFIGFDGCLQFDVHCNLILSFGNLFHQISFEMLVKQHWADYSTLL